MKVIMLLVCLSFSVLLAAQTNKGTVKVRKQRTDIVKAMAVDEMPTFPGGDTAMLMFLSKNTSYPESAVIDRIQGIVLVRFVVEKDGSITGVGVARGVHPLLDAEAIRVVKSMPKWNPGVLDRNPVPVSYGLPINFRLN